MFIYINKQNATKKSNGINRKHTQIVSVMQFPMAVTLSDIWVSVWERECIIMVHCMCECCGTAKWRHWSSWWRPHCRTDWITRMNCMVVLPMLLLCMFTLIGSTANQRICFGHREPRPYGQVIAPTIGTMRTTMVPVNMHSTTTTTSLRYTRKVSNL